MDSTFLVTLVSGACIGAAGGYLGSLMLGRRMALVAGPLGHLTLPGIALALLYGFDVSLGAFPFVILGVALIWILERQTRLPMEALTALVFATGVALTFLFLPIEQAETALVGDIAKTSVRDALFSIATCLVLVWVVHRLYRSLVLINISEDLATSVGVDVRWHNLVYLLLIAIVVALGVKMVGGLLTSALVAIPAVTARNIGRNLRQYAWGAMALGTTSAVIGVLLFDITGFPAGPLIVIVSAVLFVGSLAFVNTNA
jgi:ABC-type Mn2+/Zn2+ transport system permease subunit